MYLSPQSARSALPSFIGRPMGRYLSGAASSKARRASRLSAIAPEDAAEQIFPQARVRGGAGHNAATRSAIVSAAQAGQMVQPSGAIAYAPGSGDCSGVSLLKPAITGTIGNLALKFAPQAFAAGPIVGGIVLAVAGIAQLFTVIFGHHAAAIKKERSILCAAVPAANQALQLIDAAIQAGQATADQAPAALDNVVSGFQQAVRPILHGADPTSSGECNAACVMLSELRAIVALKKSQYQDLADAQANPAAAVTGAVASAASSLGIPSWALYAGAGLLLWKLL